MTGSDKIIAFDVIVDAFHFFTVEQKDPENPVFTRRMAILMADCFGWNVENIVRYLEAIGLLKNKSWEWFVDNGGFTIEHFYEARTGKKIYG